MANDAARLERTLAKTAAAALAVSRAEGAAVFGELACRLAEILEVDATLIGRYNGEGCRRVTTVATCLDGRLLKSFEYDIERSPCRAMAGRESRFVASGVRSEFAPDTLFHAQGFDSYAAHTLTNVSGQPIGLIVAMHRRPLADRALTEALLQLFAVRASAELERQQISAEARASEQSYRAIFDAAEDAIFVHELETGRILDVNSKACEMYGYSRDELLAIRIADVSSNVPPYTEAEAIAHIDQARRDGVTRFEWHRRSKDGSLHWDEVVLKRAMIGGEQRILAFTREITARKEALEALRLREEQYRAIFEGSADALVLWSRDIRIVDVNAAFTRMYGYTRDEILGSTFGDRLPTLDVARRIRMMQRAIEGKTGTLETRTIRKSGEPFDVEIRYLPIQHRGEPHVLAIARDITERRRAEAALRASEAQYRSIFEAATDALQLIDARHRVVDVNPAYERMYGRRREDVVGKSIEELVNPEYRAERMALVNRALAGEIAEVQSTGFREHGQPFDLEVRCIPFEHHGERHVLGIARDITGRKRAEAALRDSEEQYRAIFNASADALVLRDANFRIVDVNATYEAMSGYKREAVLGLDQVVANPPQYAPTIRAMHERALAGERVELETTLERPDGKRYDLELRGVPILHRGTPHVLYMGRDVSARKSAESRRQELESQLRQAQKMEAIGHLTGGIAHDFNNILTSVMGYAALAAERPAAEADPKLRSHLEQVEQSCHRARDLIQQMLTFSRGRRGEPRPVALGTLIAESARMLRATLPATLDLVTRTDGDPLALVDPVQAHQILLNLCINARDAMKEMGRIVVTARRRVLSATHCASCRRSFEGEFAELSVADSGTGIEPDVMERIFEPFFTTKEIGQGTGMGLAIIHGVVHDHGGHVVVESSRGAGTTFRILLPLARGALPPATAAEPARTTPAPLAGRILLVEDEQSVLGFMCELLEGWGAEVVAARDPADALRWFTLEPERFDVVVTDHTMPGMTGLELARELTSRRPALPVLMYSGRSELLSPASAQAAGVRELLPKPIDPAALHAALRSALAPA
jgi:PAS domain S-box-containing protein